MRALAVLAAALILVGCGPIPEDAGDGEGAAAAAPSQVAAAPLDVRELGLIVDPSASVPRADLIAALGAFADAVRGAPRPVPARDASPAQPVLRVRVRAISGRAYESAGELLAGEVPGVPPVDAIAAEVDPAEQTDLLVQDHVRRSRARDAYDVARREAAGLARRIERLRPPVARCSDVWGAVSAAAETLTASDRRLVVASDMSQHCPANRSGSLRGVRVLIVHVCFDAKSCGRQAAAARRELRRLGAAAVSYARPETMRAAIAAFVTEA
jgi:hypothetical protein